MWVAVGISGAVLAGTILSKAVPALIDFVRDDSTDVSHRIGLGVASFFMLMWSLCMALTCFCGHAENCSEPADRHLPLFGGIVSFIVFVGPSFLMVKGLIRAGVRRIKDYVPDRPQKVLVGRVCPNCNRLTDAFCEHCGELQRGAR